MATNRMITAVFNNNGENALFPKKYPSSPIRAIINIDPDKPLLLTIALEDYSEKCISDQIL
jgi:hypothetical protein